MRGYKTRYSLVNPYLDTYMNKKLKKGTKMFLFLINIHQWVDVTKTLSILNELARDFLMKDQLTSFLYLGE